MTELELAPAEEMTDRTVRRLREAGALLEGHFLLSSGRHAGQYIQCAQLLQHPALAGQVCSDLASRIRAATGEERPFDIVVGPALGAVTFAYEVARALGVRGLFAERRVGGGFELRRGFEIQPHERVLVAEDVVTTGGSVKEVLSMLHETGISTVAVAALVNRSADQGNPFGDTAFFRLADLEVPNWVPEQCPLCKTGSPAVKPGSRPGLE